MFRQATKALKDEDYIYICFHIHGNLFSLKHLHATTKTLKQMITELLSADDATLVACSDPALQHITFHVAETAQHFGLDVSLKQTILPNQPAFVEEYHPPAIMAGQTELKSVQQFNWNHDLP